MDLVLWGGEKDKRDKKRTLGIREKQILYENAGGRCQNPACGKRIGFSEMQVGHKKAWSSGGRTTLKNSVCLCYRCNKLQGRDSWAVFLRKKGVKDPAAQLKSKLESLSLDQLKTLARKHNVKVAGSVEEHLFNTVRKGPTKKQYVAKLRRAMSDKEIRSIRKQTKPTKKARRKKKKESFSLWDMKL